jgi:hypothetical protein
VLLGKTIIPKSVAATPKQDISRSHQSTRFAGPQIPNAIAACAQLSASCTSCSGLSDWYEDTSPMTRERRARQWLPQSDGARPGWSSSSDLWFVVLGSNLARTDACEEPEPAARVAHDILAATRYRPPLAATAGAARLRHMTNLPENGLRITRQTYEFQTLTRDFEHPLLLRPMPRGTKVKVITTTVETAPDDEAPVKPFHRELEIPEAFATPAVAEAKPAKSSAKPTIEPPVTIDVTDRVL